MLEIKNLQTSGHTWPGGSFSIMATLDRVMYDDLVRQGLPPGITAMLDTLANTHDIHIECPGDSRHTEVAAELARPFPGEICSLVDGVLTIGTELKYAPRAASYPAEIPRIHAMRKRLRQDRLVMGRAMRNATRGRRLSTDRLPPIGTLTPDMRMCLGADEFLASLLGPSGQLSPDMVAAIADYHWLDPTDLTSDGWPPGAHVEVYPWDFFDGEPYDPECYLSRVDMDLNKIPMVPWVAVAQWNRRPDPPQRLPLVDSPNSRAIQHYLRAFESPPNIQPVSLKRFIELLLAPLCPWMMGLEERCHMVQTRCLFSLTEWHPQLPLPIVCQTLEDLEDCVRWLFNELYTDDMRFLPLTPLVLDTLHALGFPDYHRYQVWYTFLRPREIPVDLAERNDLNRVRAQVIAQVLEPSWMIEPGRAIHQVIQPFWDTYAASVAAKMPSDVAAHTMCMGLIKDRLSKASQLVPGGRNSTPEDITALNLLQSLPPTVERQFVLALYFGWNTAIPDPTMHYPSRVYGNRVNHPAFPFASLF